MIAVVSGIYAPIQAEVVMFRRMTPAAGGCDSDRYLQPCPTISSQNVTFKPYRNWGSVF
jgi:hypothetical protein